MDMIFFNGNSHSFVAQFYGTKIAIDQQKFYGSLIDLQIFSFSLQRKHFLTISQFFN